MPNIDETQRKRYLSCGGYGWDYNDQWRVELRYVWDITLAGQWYEFHIYPLPSMDWDKRRWLGKIEPLPLQEMINEGENRAMEFLKKYA